MRVTVFGGTSPLGPHGRSPGLPIAAGIRRIVSAMDDAGVRRIVQVSTASAHDERDLPDFRQRFLVAAVQTFWPSAYSEIVAMAQVVGASDLEWTLMRVPVLRTSHRATKPVGVGYPGRDTIGFFVSRENAAAFMADGVGDATSGKRPWSVTHRAPGGLAPPSELAICSKLCYN